MPRLSKSSDSGRVSPVRDSGVAIAIASPLLCWPAESHDGVLQMSSARAGTDPANGSLARRPTWVKSVPATGCNRKWSLGLPGGLVGWQARTSHKRYVLGSHATYVLPTDHP